MLASCYMLGHRRITAEIKEDLGEIWHLSLKHYVNHLALSHYFLQELVFPGADPRWSLAELIHAVILMAHAHSLCSFVWGCGLNPEPDHTGGYTFQPPSPSHLTHSPAHEDGRQEVSPFYIPGGNVDTEHPTWEWQNIRTGLILLSVVTPI